MQYLGSQPARSKIFPALASIPRNGSTGSKGNVYSYAARLSPESEREMGREHVPACLQNN